MDLLAIIDAVQKKELRDGYDSLTPAEKIVSLVSALEAEMNNGGFDQLFFHAAGDRIGEIIDALRRIGAANAAAIVDEACRIFPEGKPSADRDARQDQLDQLSEESFEELDERFYEYPDPLGELVLAYWEKSAL